MPTYLRSFYSNQLIKAKEEEKKQMEKVNKKSSPSIGRPSIPRR
mgnify:FL=1|tara:strand:+ start:1064 stop:1195 length:132 start_codon:yes stop_codon:yes gene_type:complete